MSGLSMELPIVGPRELVVAMLPAALTAAAVATVTVSPAAKRARSKLPSASDRMMVGTTGSTAACANVGGSPATLLSRIKPMAPAAWATATLSLMLQAPRRIIATSPAMELAGKAKHPSLAAGAAGFAADALTLPAKAPGAQAKVLVLKIVRAIDAGALMTSGTTVPLGMAVCATLMTEVAVDGEPVM